MTSTMTIELRRDTVSVFCDIGGATNSGDIGLNLGPRDFYAEQLVLQLPNPTLTELLPIREGNALLVDTLRELGVDWVRFPIMGMFINGQINWAETIRRYNFQAENLCDRGIGVLPILTEKLAPEFPLDLTTDPGQSYADFQNAYQSRVADIVKGMPNIVRWEIWNEPDLDKNYFALSGVQNIDQVKLGQFADLMRDTRQTIEENYTRPVPSPQIVSGGISDVWPGAGKNWIQQLVANVSISTDYLPHLNFIGVHPYVYSTEVISRSIDPSRYLTHTEDNTGDSPLEDVARLFNNMQLSVTEIGWESSQESSGYGIDECAKKIPMVDNPNNTGTIVSEERQATFLRNSYEILLDGNQTHLAGLPGQKSVKGVFWYRYDDIQEGMPKSRYDECRSATVVYGNPNQLRADTQPIGIGVPVTTIRTDPLAFTDTYVAINKWWGIIDLERNKKRSYCALMTVAVEQGDLESYSDPCQAAPTEITYQVASINSSSKTYPTVWGIGALLLLASMFALKREEK